MSSGHARRARMTLRDELREVWTLGGMRPRTLVKRVWHQTNADDVWGYAAQLAYYFLFSLFPFFIFLAALLAYIPIPDLLEQVMALLGEFLPATVLDMVQDNVLELVTQPRGGLLSFGILLALWIAASGIAAMTDSLNRAYGVREGRPFWKVRLIAVLLTIGLAALLLASMALLIFGSELGGIIAAKVGLGAAFDAAWQIVRWPIIVFLMMFGAALIYYFAPDVEQEWRWITPGAVFAVLAWVLMSLVFAWYVDRFGNYNVTYGSIGAVIILLTWMYATGFFLLVGGEINAEIEHAAASGKAKGKKKLPK